MTIQYQSKIVINGHLLDATQERAFYAAVSTLNFLLNHPQMSRQIRSSIGYRQLAAVEEIMQMMDDEVVQ